MQSHSNSRSISDGLTRDSCAGSTDRRLLGGCQDSLQFVLSPVFLSPGLCLENRQIRRDACRIFSAQRAQQVGLVAVTDCSANEGFLFGNEDNRIGGLDGRFSLNKGFVAGILTVDTVADFLPRKGPLSQWRTGSTYQMLRSVRNSIRQDIAKKLVAKVEAQARSWGCRAIALHCDTNNPGVIKLYRDQG